MSSPAHDQPKAAPAFRRRRRTRRWLLIAVALIALVLWQLNPLIAALGAAQTGLEHAQGIRMILVELVSRLYHAVSATVRSSVSG